MTPLPELPDPSRRRALRELMGITIRQAACELGVSSVSYAFWERGERTPRPEHLRAYYSQLCAWREAADGVT